MKGLNFKSQICTTMEQSKRLLELGLNPETADMHHFKQSGEFSAHLGFFIDTYKNISNWYQPAWSLHRLLCLYEQDYTFKEIYNNAEECYGMLISAIGIAIQEGYFNKEYLK